MRECVSVRTRATVCVHICVCVCESDRGCLYPETCILEYIFMWECVYVSTKSVCGDSPLSRGTRTMWDRRGTLKCELEDNGYT